MVQKEKQMEKQPIRIGKGVLLFTFLIVGLTPLLFAQKPVVSLSVSEKKIGENTPLTVTVSTNLNGTVKIDYPEEFVVDNGLMHGMEQKVDQTCGKIKTYYYMQQSGSFRKTGSYSFYAYVKYRGANYRSNKITVTVSEEEPANDDNAGFNSKEPIFGVIQAKKTTVYEGEPVLLKAKIFSYVDIYLLEGYSPYKADKHAEEHVFQNQRYELERAKYNGKNVLTFEYGKQLLFPVGTGKCKIAPFEMALRCHGTFLDKTVSFRSSSATINIKPLPDGAPSSFIGAVGVFDMSQELGSTEIKQGDVFTLTLKVNGLGNLHNTNAPDLNLPKGCSIYGEPEKTTDYNYTEEGVEGSITYSYNIQVTTSGKVRFPAPSIAYFNPSTEEYVTVKTAAFNLNVEADKHYQPVIDQSQPMIQKEALQVASTPLRSEKEEPIVTEEGVSTLLSIVGPITLVGLLVFFFLGIRRRKEKQEVSSKPCISHFSKNEPCNSVDYWAEVETTLNDPNAFAVLLPKAIIQGLEQCWDCTDEPMTRERAFQKLEDVNHDVAIELRGIVEQCDQFRYGFGDIQLDTHYLFTRTKELVTRLK